MRHVPDGTLRRMSDEPLAVPDAAADHRDRCARCRRRDSLIAENASRASQLLATPQLVLDVDQAWRRLQYRLVAAPDARARAGGLGPRHLRLSMRAVAVVMAAGVLVAGAAAAATLTTVFAPERVAPVKIQPGDLEAIAGLLGSDGSRLLGGFAAPSGSVPTRFGRLHWDSAAPRPKASRAGAEAATGLALSLPRSLPHGVGVAPRFVVQPKVTVTITLGAATGPALAGRTLSVIAGPAVLARYGSPPGSPSLPTLGIMTMKRPIASSTGATTAQLVAFLLSQPGFPPDLAAEIRLLDLGRTLPVPAPPGTDSTAVAIGGSRGVLLADTSGAASAVIWEDRGILHLVAGLLNREDVLSVARQLG